MLPSLLALVVAGAVTPSPDPQAPPSPPDAPAGPSGRLRELSDPASAAAPRSRYAPEVSAPLRGAEPIVHGSPVDFLAAAVTAKQDGTEYAVSVTPSAAFDLPYVPLASDATLGVSTDTSTALTRFSVSTGVDPFSLRGPRAQRAIDRSNERWRCSELRTDELPACRRSCEELGAEPQRQACAARCDAALPTALERCNRRRLASEWEGINDSWWPALTASASFDVFPTGTTQAAGAAEAAPAVRRGWGGTVLQAAASFRKWETVQAKLWGSFRPRWRPASDALLARYEGGGASAAWLAVPFVARAALLDHPDYVKGGFIPGLALGASVQAQRCEDRAACDRGRVRQASVTPFLEARVRPAIQVRIAVPVIHYRQVAGSGTELAPTLTVAVAVGPTG